MAQKRSAVQVSIVMGSDSDWPVMKTAYSTLRDLGVLSEVKVISAHRTPRAMLEHAESARSRGIKVIIAGAGGAAHLPGMIASSTTLPVIGVPVSITAAKGLDALLSIAQMPSGVPVATVAIDNSTNAALLAAQILSITDLEIAARLERKLATLRKKSKQKVRAANLNLKRLL